MQPNANRAIDDGLHNAVKRLYLQIAHGDAVADIELCLASLGLAREECTLEPCHVKTQGVDFHSSNNVTRCLRNPFILKAARHFGQAQSKRWPLWPLWLGLTVLVELFRPDCALGLRARVHGEIYSGFAARNFL